MTWMNPITLIWGYAQLKAAWQCLTKHTGQPYWDTATNRSSKELPKFQWLLLRFKSCAGTRAPHQAAGTKPGLYLHIKAPLQHCTICNHRTVLNRLDNTCPAAWTLPRQTWHSVHTYLLLFLIKLPLLLAPFNQHDTAQFLLLPERDPT